MSLLVQVGCCEGSRIVGLAITTRCISVGTDNEARSCGHVVAPWSVVVYSRRRLYYDGREGPSRSEPDAMAMKRWYNAMLKKRIAS